MSRATSPLPKERLAVAALKAAGFEWTCDVWGWGYFHLDDKALVHVKKLSSIAFLDLFEACDMDRVSDEGIANLARNKSLICLRLGPGITDAGLAHLKGLTQLTELRLDNAESVTDVGVKYLKRLRNLESLSLQYTKVGDAAMREIAHLIKLKVLEVNHTGVTDEGLTFLGQMKELNQLMLSDTAVSDAGLSQLLPHAKMRLLYLENTNVTDSGLSQLSHMKALESLLLRGKQITDAAVPHLLRFRKLKQLYLTDTRVSKSSVDRLKTGLPACQIVRSGRG